MKVLVYLLSLANLLTAASNKSYTPVVLWHGMGDSCCNPNYMGKLEKLLKENLPGVHVLPLRIGNSVSEQVVNSFIMHPDDQIEIACNAIKSDPLLSNGYNAVGISQGSQFLRGLAQRCPQPRMKNLISMAGQHQGVYGLPFCNSVSKPSCYLLHWTISQGVYLDYVQESLAQATYWHDPLKEKVYGEKSTFIADINNERVINQTYIENLQSVENFVMVKYAFETMVQPSESSWFGFYKPGHVKEVQTLQESELYKQDRLGLKQMDQDGKLHFLLAPWAHWEFKWPWFKENIVDKYLN